jgi:hypothetical protein
MELQELVVQHPFRLDRVLDLAAADLAGSCAEAAAQANSRERSASGRTRKR